MMAKQRDYKRRRQTYRAKNVHITKRSTVEVNVAEFFVEVLSCHGIILYCDKLFTFSRIPIVIPGVYEL